ncbi:MAG: hypothetical protein ACQEQ0_10370 [Bacteroidota bacterium]
MKTAIQIILTIAILALGYLSVKSIQKPVRFNQAYDARQEKVIERLKNIRAAQRAYKSINGEFTGSFDTLIEFVKTDSLRLVRMEGSLTDSMIEEGLNEQKALERGIIQRDTTRVSVKDSLMGEDYIADSLRYVPFNDQEEIEMDAAILETGSGADVPVFEAKIHHEKYLKGLDEQQIINVIDEDLSYERYPGLKVGSLEEANNSAGNWE